MGRKNQAQKPKEPNTKLTKSNRSNPTTEEDLTATAEAEHELHDLVDKLLQLSTIPQETNIPRAFQHQKEISEIVEQIKSLESRVIKNKNHNNNRCSPATIEKFLKWVQENGGEIQGCEITPFEGYDLGMKATMDIVQSSRVLAVPRRLMLTVEKAHKSKLKKLIEKDHILRNMPNVTLALYLLLEHYNEHSFWRPYIDMLPKTYTTVLFFSLEELEELKGSPTLEIALRQNKCIARQYAYFHKMFHMCDEPASRIMKDKFTYVDYCWAVSSVMTRQNSVPSEDGDHHMVNTLIPVWDMCNHTNGIITTDYNPELDRIELMALKDFKMGEQLLIFYGARSNADFFIHNGFVYEENEYDSYWIRLGVSKSDPLKEKRNELLMRLNISGSCDFFIRKSSQPVDGKLLAFIRIFNMTEDHLQHWLESDRVGDLQYADCALDTALEKKSWSFLQARLKLLMASYQTSLEDDLKLLEESRNTSSKTNNSNNNNNNKINEMSANKRLAIRMRASEKRLLQDTLQYVEQYIKQ